MTTSPDPTSDPRIPLRQAFEQAAGVIEGVSPAQLGAPTPCREFTVEALLEHIVGVGYRVAGVGRGEPQTGKLRSVTDVPADGWPKTFSIAHREALDAWENDGLLGRELQLPFGTFSGAVVAQIYTLELVTHTWDLAVATEQAPTLDPTLAEISLPVAHQVLPSQPRGGDVPFDAVVSVPDDAPPYDRLAAYLGRARHS